LPQVYTSTGSYTVTLTVGDGVDTSIITRTNYIQVMHRVYLPIAMRNYDPLFYDDFNDSTFDGSYNPARWTFSNWPGFFRVSQQNGDLVFTNTITTTIGGADMIMVPGQRSLSQLRLFEGRLKISSDRSGGWSSVQLFIQSDNVNGHGWFTQCFLGGAPENATASFSCDVAFQSGNLWPREYSIPSISVNYDTWYTIRIEADPTTATLSYFLSGVPVGSHVPNDAAALIVATNLRPSISVYNGDPNAFSTRYVDDVRITLP